MNDNVTRLREVEFYYAKHGDGSEFLKSLHRLPA